MDWFRAVLIVAIAVLGWNIIYQWSEDYGHGPSVVDAAPQSDEQGAAQIGLPAGQVVQTPSQSSSELNTGLVPQSTSTPQVDVKAVEQKLIGVQTDLFEAQIDLVGGDLVSLALKEYPRAIESPDEPFKMFVNNSAAKYVAESGIIGASAVDLDASPEEGRPVFTAVQSAYRMKNQSLVIPLEYTNPAGMVFEKRYVFTKGSYQVQVEFEIKNTTGEQWLGLPYGRLRRSGFSDPSEAGGFGLPTFLGVAYWDPEDKFTKVDFDDLEDTGSNKPHLNTTLQAGWIGILQHYFVAAWTPSADTQNQFRAMYSENASVPGGREYIADSITPQIAVQPGETFTTSQSLYVGPKIQDNLKEAAQGLHLAVDYGPLFFISDFLMLILSVIYGIVGNYGFAIILLTCVVKASLFYFSAKGYKSMARMREMQPKMAELKKKFGDDRQKMSQELMKMYQKEGVNPLGGCIPMLIQMPVFLALYWALLESVELRQAPFIFWIQDLSIMDPYFVLPLIMGASMWFQQKLNPEPPDPMQAKVMKFMPIAMTFLFLFFPAGLVLYWVTNNILSISQQAYITRKVANASKA